MTSILTSTSLPSSSGVTSATNQVFNTLGRPTETDVYDFGTSGSGTYGSLLSKTLTTYASLGQEYGHPATVTTYGPGGSTVTGETTYGYDQTAVVATSGLTQHTAGFNVGNMTTMKRLVSGTNTWLTETYTYNDTGTLATSTDVNGTKTTYTVNQCNGAFPGSTSTPVTAVGVSTVTLTTSQTWNCGESTLASSTDINGNTATAQYSDPYDRPTVRVDGFNNETTYTYPSATANSSLSSMIFNGGSSTIGSATTYDGLGRTILQQKAQQPGSGSTYDSVAISYNSIGLTSYSSMPYAANLGVRTVSGPGTTSTYDGIGRPLLVTDGGGGTMQYAYAGNDVTLTTGPAPAGEAVKIRVLESDGSGALRSVCEVNGLAGSGPCGQYATNTGYLTKYTLGANVMTVQQNLQPNAIGGVQTRTVNADLLGRTTSETIPELGNGSPGTMTYKYDSDSTGTCAGTYTGDLVYKKDAAGNVTCYTYDNQHRMLSTKVVSGPQASVTAQSRFVYDVGNFGGVPFKNAIGSAVEAYTCASASSCGTKLTDLYADTYPEGSPGAYTGRTISQVWQWSTNSGAYYTSQSTNFPNGARANFIASKLTTPASAIMPQLAYALDGEGRTKAVTDTTNSLNLVSGVTYNAMSGATAIAYGNGDSDTYTPDPNTGRVTNFQNVVTGSTPFTNTGVPAWNANGSLHTFAWTDGSNGARSQNCTYASDALNRIASVNCTGTAWAQTFTYDAFGNLFKSGSSSYSPSSYSNNQPVSNVTAMYDANGNQTMTNLVSSLTYDANHNPVAAGSTNMLYDALGRMLEAGGNAVVYGPAGERLGVFNGTNSTVKFALPGGGEALYTNGAFTSLRRKDWLGNSRLSTSWAHAVVTKTNYAPFGETYSVANANDFDFTGMTQDSVSTLFDFPARKYDPNSGRWTTPDPGGWSVVDPTNPQTFNRYAYVIGNPMASVDPLGLDYFVCFTGGAQCADVSDQEFLLAYGSYMSQANIDAGQNGYTNSSIKNYAGLAGLTAFTTNGMVTATAQYFDTSTSPFGNGMTTDQGFNGNPHANDGQKYGPAPSNQQLQQQINQMQQQINALQQPKPLSNCDKMEKQGGVMAGAGAGLEVWGLAADAGVVTAPVGISLHAAGTAAMLTGGIWAGIGAFGNLFGVCQ